MARLGQLSKNIKELRVLFCQSSPTSSSTRAFVEKNYKDLKKANPKLPILIRECSGTEPQLWARYGERLIVLIVYKFISPERNFQLRIFNFLLKERKGERTSTELGIRKSLILEGLKPLNLFKNELTSCVLPALPPSIQASAGGVNEPRHYTRRNASASTSRTLYDESDEDLVGEDYIVDLGNDGEIRNENLDDFSQQK
ncbi:NADH dehydrogenase [ubiquinone] 1 alpha subcomplex subunit 2-like protein [Tanacetum coccineum]